MEGSFKKLWLSSRKYLFVAAAAIAFYELLEHLPALLGIIRKVRAVVMPIILGLCMAFVAGMPVRFFEEKPLKSLVRKRPRLARGIAVALSYLIILGVCGLIAALVVPKVIGSVTVLVDNFEGYYQAVSQRLFAMWDGLNLTPEAETEILDVLNSLFVKLKALAVELLPRLLGLTRGVAGAVYTLLVMTVISVYALLNKEKLLSQARRVLQALLPRAAVDALAHYAAFAGRTFRRYIAGQLTSCSIIGALCYIGMRILGMPYPELISVFIAAAALIPIIGPWASTLPSAFIILMARQDKPWLALWFLLLVLIVQQLDDNLVYPRVVGDAVGISGIWVLAAIVIAGGLFGIAGLLVAVPTAAVIYRIAGDWTYARLKKRAGA